MDSSVILVYLLVMLLLGYVKLICLYLIVVDTCEYICDCDNVVCSESVQWFLPTLWNCKLQWWTFEPNLMHICCWPFICLLVYYYVYCSGMCSFCYRMFRLFGISGQPKPCYDSSGVCYFLLTCCHLFSVIPYLQFTYFCVFIASVLIVRN